MVSGIPAILSWEHDIIISLGSNRKAIIKRIFRVIAPQLRLSETRDFYAILSNYQIIKT